MPHRADLAALYSCESAPRKVSPLLRFTMRSGTCSNTSMVSPVCHAECSRVKRRRIRDNSHMPVHLAGTCSIPTSHVRSPDRSPMSLYLALYRSRLDAEASTNQAVPTSSHHPRGSVHVVTVDAMAFGISPIMAPRATRRLCRHAFGAVHVPKHAACLHYLLRARGPRASSGVQAVLVGSPTPTVPGLTPYFQADALKKIIVASHAEDRPERAGGQWAEFRRRIGAPWCKGMQEPSIEREQTALECLRLDHLLRAARGRKESRCHAHADTTQALRAAAVPVPRTSSAG
ncbi:hypothetical protein RJ55_02836 [Drechmeria coniospora]|nr:hypothetical protein RJ55_02836 [Drechmeria coniospora]